MDDKNTTGECAEVDTIVQAVIENITLVDHTLYAYLSTLCWREYVGFSGPLLSHSSILTVDTNF